MWILIIFVQLSLALDHPRRATTQPRELAGKKKSKPSSSSSSGKKKKGGWGFEEAGVGVCLIFIALPMIWMNERKDVKIYKVITRGRDEVIEASCDDPQEENQYKLIHVQGETSTESQVADEMFGLVYNDVLKIKRSVEVYQWKEVVE